MAEILIIDDEPEVVVLTKKALEKEGHNVLEAMDGKEGMTILTDKNPDLILLDVMLKGENGWEICRRIKSDEKTKDIPVLMFTVLTNAHEKKKSLECADGQIDKPFKIKTLLNTVSEFANPT